MEGQHGPPPARAGGSRCGLVRSSTTTDASPSSHEQQGLLNALPFRRIASQPEGTSATRAVEARRVKFQRLDRTKKLDKYVPVMKNMCVAHLLEKGVLELEHFPAPCSDLDAHSDIYQAFRRQFKFKVYTYCFICSLPQDQNHNSEGLECHRAHIPGGKEKCLFQHVMFKMAFMAGQIEHLLMKMQAELRIPRNTFKEFLNWVVSQKEEEGHYHNTVEVFLWCYEWLK